MIDRPQWVIWRYEPRGDRQTKVPYQPREPGRRAKADDPSTWGTFDEAWDAYRRGGFDGIGYEFSADDPYFGVDVDNCLRAGQLLPWAVEIVARLAGTYREISPSGNGIKFVARGKLPAEKGTRRGGLGPDGTGALEVYDHGRFFAITGNVWGDEDGIPGILDLPDVAAELYRMAKGHPAAQGKGRSSCQAGGGSPAVGIDHTDHDDEEVLRVARRSKDFAALWDGGLCGFPSPSEADLGLCNRLAFCCGPGRHDQVKRLFLQSTPGQREKALGRMDYVDRTVAKAYENRTDYFRWGSSSSSNGRSGGNGNGDGRHRKDGDDRPPVEINTRRDIVVAETIKTLARDGDLFRRGETLGIVIAEEGDTAKLAGGVELRHARGNLRFIPLAQSVLGCRLTRNASFFRWGADKHGEWVAIDCHPPDWLIAAVTEHRYWPGVRHLLTITECPYILADGSMATPGFDRATGTLYRPSVKIPRLPDRPTRADARKAQARLYELVCQFPFEDGFSFAVWLANLLTCIQRPTIAGPVPGFAYNGNVAGVGKGLLIDLHGIFVWGHPVATRAYPTDPDEAEKVKLALALAAVPIVHFDNLPEGGYYGGGVIDSSLTSMFAEGRILGLSRDSGPVPLRPIWTLSGNNISPRQDANRRWPRCNLMTALERPYQRSDIRRGNLREYALAHRASYLRDALTILKAHALAGRPTGPDPTDPNARWAPLGSYEEWDPIVRGAVWYATGSDCLHTQNTADEERPDRMKKVALLEGWLEIDPHREGKTIEEAIALVSGFPDRYPTLRAALIGIGRDNKLPSVDKLAYKLRSMKNTPIRGMRFETAGATREKVKFWKVVAC